MGGRLRILLRLTFAGDNIAGIEAVADAERLGGFDLEMLDA
jgi:RNA polymerase sigma-70 factor (ECF subfamily)